MCKAKTSKVLYWAHVDRVILGVQRLPHRHRHDQFLSQFLFSKRNRTACHHNHISASIL